MLHRLSTIYLETSVGGLKRHASRDVAISIAEGDSNIAAKLLVRADLREMARIVE